KPDRREDFANGPQPKSCQVASSGQTLNLMFISFSPALLALSTSCVNCSSRPSLHCCQTCSLMALSPSPAYSFSLPIAPVSSLCSRCNLPASLSEEALASSSVNCGCFPW